MAKRPVTIRAIRRYSNRFASDIFFSPSYRELQYPNPKAKFCSALAYVRFGSKADICGALSHVRPPPKANMCSAVANVCYGPKADIGRLQAFRKGTQPRAAKSP